MQKRITGKEKKTGVGILGVGKLGLGLVCPDCLYNCLWSEEIYVAYYADPII